MPPRMHLKVRNVGRMSEFCRGISIQMKAFDFINGTVGHDASDWKTFEIVAAADGVAMQSIEDGCRKDEVPLPGRVTCSDMSMASLS